VPKYVGVVSREPESWEAKGGYGAANIIACQLGYLIAGERASE